MQLQIAVGVVGDFKQRLEDVAEELLEVVHYLVRLEDVAEIEDLNVIVFHYVTLELFGSKTSLHT